MRTRRIFLLVAAAALAPACMTGRARTAAGSSSPVKLASVTLAISGMT